MRLQVCSGQQAHTDTRGRACARRGRWAGAFWRWCAGTPVTSAAHGAQVYFGRTSAPRVVTTRVAQFRMGWSLLWVKVASPYNNWVAIVQPPAYEGVHQCLCSLVGQRLANCTDVAEGHVRSTADLVDVCCHTQPAAPQHSQVACDTSDRDVGSRKVPVKIPSFWRVRWMMMGVWFFNYYSSVCVQSSRIASPRHSPLQCQQFEWCQGYWKPDRAGIRSHLHRVAHPGCVGAQCQRLGRKQLRPQRRPVVGRHNPASVCERRSRLWV